MGEKTQKLILTMPGYERVFETRHKYMKGLLAQGESRWQSRGSQHFQVLHSENWTQTENSFLAATGKLQSWAETWIVSETSPLEKWVKGKNAPVKKETWVSHPTGWEGLAGQETGETQRCSQENQTDNSKMVWFSLTSGMRRLLAREKSSVFLK